MAHTFRNLAGARINARRMRNHQTRVTELRAAEQLRQTGRVRVRVATRARGAVLPNDRDDRAVACYREARHRLEVAG